jgi:hypothetical protein
MPLSMSPAYPPARGSPGVPEHGGPKRPRATEAGLSRSGRCWPAPRQEQGLAIIDVHDSTLPLGQPVRQSRAKRLRIDERKRAPPLTRVSLLSNLDSVVTAAPKVLAQGLRKLGSTTTSGSRWTSCERLAPPRGNARRELWKLSTRESETSDRAGWRSNWGSMRGVLLSVTGRADHDGACLQVSCGCA